MMCGLTLRWPYYGDQPAVPHRPPPPHLHMPPYVSTSAALLVPRPLYRRLEKFPSTSTERQKRSLNLAPVLVILYGNSLVFSRKIITSLGFYRCRAAGASAPVVVKNQSSHCRKSFKKGSLKRGGFDAKGSIEPCLWL